MINLYADSNNIQNIKTLTMLIGGGLVLNWKVLVLLDPFSSHKQNFRPFPLGGTVSNQVVSYIL